MVKYSDGQRFEYLGGIALKNRILDLTPEILEENYMNFDMCLLAAYSETHFRIFLKDSEPGGFLANLREAEVDIKLPMQIVTKNLKSKNMSIILEHYEEILEMVRTVELSRDMILESDYPRLIQAILIYIADYYERDRDLFSKEDITGQVSFITNYFMEHLSILIYLSILYEYNQINKMEIDDERKTCISNLLKMYQTCSVCRITGSIMADELNSLNETVRQCEIEAKRKERAISKKKKLIEDLRAEMKAQKNRNESRVQEDCEKIKKDLEKYKKAFEEERTKIQQMGKSMVAREEYEKKEKEVADAHAKYCERGRKISELEKKLKDMDIENELEVFKAYLKRHGLSDELYQLMYPYYDAYVSGVIPDAELAGDNLSYIGYTRLVDGQHHVFNPKGTGFRLFNLPEDAYLAENQFVAVSSKNTFIRSYLSFYNGERNFSSLAEVSSLDPVCAYTTKNNEEKIWPNAVANLSRGDIVGLSGGKVVLTRYEKKAICIGDILPSIKARGHGAFYVLKTVANGSLVYDFADRSEKVLTANGDGLTNGKIATLRGKDLVRYFDDEDFIYSSLPSDGSRMGFYKETEMGKFIAFGDGTCRLFSEFGLSGKMRDFDLEDGDIIEVNAFDTIIDAYECECEDGESDEKKIKERRDKRRREARKEERPGIPVETHPGKVLVVGSEKFANGYKSSFKKCGYDAEVVSGHGAYFDIHSAALKSDKIIFVTTAASHKNYYRIKEDFGERILYAASDGFKCILGLLKHKTV